MIGELYELCTNLMSYILMIVIVNMMQSHRLHDCRMYNIMSWNMPKCKTVVIGYITHTGMTPKMNCGFRKYYSTDVVTLWAWTKSMQIYITHYSWALCIYKLLLLITQPRNTITCDMSYIECISCAAVHGIFSFLLGNHLSNLNLRAWTFVRVVLDRCIVCVVVGWALLY